MTDNVQSESANGPATLIIGQEITPGRERDFEAWVNETHASAASFPGCLGTDSRPPKGIQKEWTSLYRFDSAAHLRTWMNSRERNELVNKLGDMLSGPATQQVIAGPEAEASEELVTVVVTHRVPAEAEEEFQRWQDRMTAAEKKFGGFLGAELFKPVHGVQDEWTAIYRYESAEALEAWLRSSDRDRLLEEGKKFQDFQLRTIQTPFGSWFAYGDDAKKGPDAFKTSVAVYVGLYPTVMLLTLGIAELFPKAVLWQTLLVGNLLSAFIMTIVIMPHYVNPMLKFWLTAGDDAPQPATNVKGLGIALATTLAWAAVFWLVTTKIWTLP